MTSQPALFDAYNAELTPEAALEARDRGVAQAVATAESVHDAWGELAYAFLAAYAGQHGEFAGWEVVRASNDSGAVPVVSGKAWGAIFLRAAHEGLIEKAGYAPDPNRHLNPAPVWRRVETGVDTPDTA